MSALVQFFSNPCLGHWIHPKASPFSSSVSKSVRMLAKEESRVTYPVIMLVLRAVLPTQITQPGFLDPFSYRQASFSVKFLCTEGAKRWGACSLPHTLGQREQDACAAAVPTNLPVWNMPLSKEGFQVEDTYQSYNAARWSENLVSSKACNAFMWEEYSVEMLAFLSPFQ